MPSTRAWCERSSPRSCSTRSGAPSPVGATMASDDLAFATIAETAARYRSRALSPVEVTRALLDRIERLDPTLHPLVTVTAQRALADARAAEAPPARAEAARPPPRPPLASHDH